MLKLIKKIDNIFSIYECSFCNSRKKMRSANVKKGYKGCGCQRSSNSKKHGLSHTPEYDSWKGMISRCYNERNKKYNRYGGRGIIVCERWKNSLENFIKDMGLRPSKGYTIHRINNDGNYYKENCKWATAQEQADNKGNTIFVTINNKTLNLAQWCKILNHKYTKILNRVKHGMSYEEALTCGSLKYPLIKYNNKFQSLFALSKEFKINYQTLITRIKSGISLHEALTTKVTGARDESGRFRRG